MTESAYVFALDVQAVLEKADSYRLPDKSALIRTRIEVYKLGVLDKSRDYDVYLKSGRRTLVIFKSPSQIGQKVLMLDDKFWLLMPKSRRPIRITPMQRLLGDASSGDIATMTWNEDYNVSLGEQNLTDKSALQLQLTAMRKSVSYKTIELFVDKTFYYPVKANLYLASGKLAKQASFLLSKRNDRLQVTAMVLIDNIQKGRKTVIQYLSNEPKSLPDKYYNPVFLTRNILRDLQ